MTYSTARASALAAICECGVTISKSLECGGPTEVDEAVADELKALTAAASQSPQSAHGISASPGDAVSQARPSRPGRGRARLTPGGRAAPTV